MQRTVTDGNTNQVTSFSYDSRDRLVSETNALNQTTTYSYDPIVISKNPISITDPAGRTTYFQYDRMQRLVQKTEANGAITKFQYDQRGNRTAVIDAFGNTMMYFYDLNDRLIRETNVSILNLDMVTKNKYNFYDKADRIVRTLVQSSAPGGENRTIAYEFDDLDKYVQKTQQREAKHLTTVEEVATYSYENQLDAKLLTNANNPIANLSFTNEAAPPYKFLFGVAAAQSGNPLGLITGNYSISRDVNGEIASISDGSNTIFTKTYDPAGRLTRAQAGAGFDVNIGYDGFSRKNSSSWSTGSQTRQYDLLNRVTGIQPSGDAVVSESLNYDLAGNITNITRENGSYTLGYDSVNQLVSSSSSGNNGFVPYNKTLQYDLLGNRQSDSVNGAGNFVSNFLTSNGVSSFLADPNGFGETIRETTGSTVKNYSYRADGRLSSYADNVKLCKLLLRRFRPQSCKSFLWLYQYVFASWY